MQISLTFKCPDVVEDTLSEMGLADVQRAEAIRACAKWVQYGEYVTVVVDTVKNTCEVTRVQ